MRFTPEASAVGPELRFLEGDDLEVRTYLGLFGRPDAVAPSRRARATLSGVVPLLREVLVRTREDGATVPGSLLLDAAGQVLSAEQDVQAWLDEAGRKSRLPVLLRVARDGHQVDGPLDGARVRLRAATGPAGTGWIGELTVPQPLELAPDALLTPTQREVAGSAAVGATCAEIARSLGIRVETVRSHVRDIYARLGISSRAELAQRLSMSTVVREPAAVAQEKRAA